MVSPTCGVIVQYLHLRKQQPVRVLKVAIVQLKVDKTDDKEMSCVQVWCRIKPALRVDGVGDSCVNLESNSTLSVETGSGSPQSALFRLQFELDHVFSESAQQKDVFELLKPRVGECLEGYSATVLTYGQTGSGLNHTLIPILCDVYPNIQCIWEHGSKLLSGKTHTILGHGQDEQQGIVPRVAEMIFERYAGIECMGNVKIFVSCLEVYQEKLRDLLSKGQSGSSSDSLRIRESAKNGIWVEGLIEKRITSCSQFREAFQSATIKRSVGSHSMNAESSRSHFCCTITVRRPGADGTLLNSKFHLVDLAGSEMVRKTDAFGQRLQEAKHINKSLSALGNVISALTSATTSADNSTDSINIQSQNKRHIPYRDSKLTRILQDSLAGNSKTTLILTISSERFSAPETIATLRFGERARKLTTKPRLNITKDADMQGQVSYAAFEIARLSSALANAQHEIMRLSEIIADSKTFSNNVTLSNPSNKISQKDCVCCALGHVSVPKFSDALAPEDAMATVASNDELLKLWSMTVQENAASRCSVCGLTEEEGSSLDYNIFSSEITNDTVSSKLYEGMNTLLTCDGNCGNYFHPRCVGITGSSGGEWFCIDCSGNLKGTDDDSKALSATTVGTLLISRITQQYHVMRLERNRLMLNWQQEKKMSVMRAAKEAAAQEKRDKELESAQERCRKLEAEIAIERAGLQLRHAYESETPHHDDVDQDEETRIEFVKPTSQRVPKSCTLHGAADGNFTRLTSNSYNKLPVLPNQNGLNIFDRSACSTGIPKPWISSKRGDKSKGIDHNVPEADVIARARSPTMSPERNKPSTCCIFSPDENESIITEIPVFHKAKINARMQVSPIRSLSSSESHISALTDQKNEDASDVCLFPIRNRLRDLLKTVELEAGSFAEIRVRHKEREAERSQLRSSRSTRSQTQSSGWDPRDVLSKSSDFEDLGDRADRGLSIRHNCAQECDTDSTAVFRSFVPSKKWRVEKLQSSPGVESACRGSRGNENTAASSTSLPNIDLTREHSKTKKSC